VRTTTMGLVLLSLGLVSAPGEALAVFRFDEIERRSFDYNREYFLNVFSYRQRLTHRWRFQDASLGYDITAGSLDNNDLYLRQEARVRLPFASNISGQFHYLEWEDYDARFQRNEVEAAFRVLRPDWRPSLLDVPGHVPPHDGLFLGLRGALAAEKEFIDVGLFAGWGAERYGVRLGLLLVDTFFNDKNSLNAEYTRDAYTVDASAYLDLLDGDLRLEGWFQGDTSLSLFLPDRFGPGLDLRFRYRQLQAGLRLRYRHSHRLRMDLEAWGEVTRKASRVQQDPTLNEDLEREALKAYAQVELDLDPLLGPGWASVGDTLFVSWHLHLLDEEIQQPFGTDEPVERRGESYLELGYVLGIPSPSEDLGFGVRGALQAGFLSLRQEVPVTGRHRVEERGLVRLGLGLEVEFLAGLGFAFGQFTFQLDDKTFGGANVQVQMHF
jgi:hypothetical protein